MLVGARLQCPMVVGLADGETFLASNAAAFLRETREVQFPSDGEIVVVTPGGSGFFRAADGSPVEHERVELDWDDEGAEKAGYETFMLKEIHEQPDAVAETIGDRLRKGRLVLEGLGMDDDELRDLSRIVILVRRHLLPRCRGGALRDRGVGPGPGRARHRLGVDLPQPCPRRGHARDRHLAVRRDARHDRGDEARARSLGAHTVAITNMMGSQITREVDSRALHARRARGQRGRVEDVHRAAERSSSSSR